MVSFAPRINRLKLGMFLLASATSTLPWQAADWPQWRGPNRDGRAKLTIKALPENLTREWTFTVGEGHASPVVANDSVYVLARHNDSEAAWRLDLKSGKMVWGKSYPAPYQVNSAALSHGAGPKSTPVVAGDKLFTLGISGILSAWKIEDGALLWQHEFSKEFSTTSPLYGTSMSPLVDKGACIAHVGGHDKGAMIAFDVETGKRRWTWEGDGPAYSSPVIATLDGVRQIVTQSQRFCIGLEAASGRLLWSIPFSTEYDQNIVTPVVFDDLVIFSGLNKGTFAVRVAKADPTWTTQDVWRNADLSMYMSSPVLDGPFLYGMTNRRAGALFCLDARTGQQQWIGDGRLGENALLAVSDDYLWALTTNSELRAFAKDEKRFNPLKAYTVAETPTWAHPAFIGDRVVIKDQHAVTVYSLKAAGK